jgi:CRP/FNR family transcriptional regulator, nitrogen oxide reductase regulator
MVNAPHKKSIPDYDLTVTELFSGLNPAEIEEVARAARTKTIEAGAFYFQEGDPAELTHVLVAGKVKLTQVTTDGQQVIMRYISPLEEFAVIAAFSSKVYPVSAEAVLKSTALTWDHDSMRKLMDRYPQIAVNAINILGARVQEFQDRLRELSTERVERRIARSLLRLVRQTGRKTSDGVLIDLPLSRQDLAEMNGTTLYTVSRILSAWETKGLVHSGRERIVIRRPHGLVAIAEDLPEIEPPTDQD